MSINMKYKGLLGYLFAAIISLILIYYAFDSVDVQYVWLRFQDLKITALFSVLILVAINFLVVTFRMVYLTRAVGNHLRFATGVLANIYGLFAALFVFNFIGSNIGRNYILQRSGTDVLSVSIVIGYERVLMAAVSASVAIVCALLIFDTNGLVEFFGQFSFVIMVPALVVTAILNTLYSFRNVEECKILFANTSAWGSALVAAGITLVAILINSFTYVVLLSELVPNINIWLAVAASLVVSFAASLPFSVNGWGIREVAAVSTFGIIGVEPGDALSVSITVGILNYIFIGVSYFIASFCREYWANNKFIKIETPHENEKLAQNAASTTHLGNALFIFNISIATLVLYSFSISIDQSYINITFSDPIAVLVFSYIVSSLLFLRRVPFLLPGYLKIWIISVSVCLGMALFLGWLRYGFIEWAFLNRGFGWLVLMGYFGLGGMIASNLGDLGVRTLIIFLVISACVIFYVTLAYHFSYEVGLFTLYPGNFDGFSGNRNAYAFQMLVIAAVGARLFFHNNRCPSMWGVFFVSSVFSAVFFSNSLTALVGLAVLVIYFIFVLEVNERRWTLLSILIAGAVRLSLPEVFDFLVYNLGVLESVSEPDIGYRIANGVEFMEPVRVSQTSLSERFESLFWGIKMWLEFPIVGAGLGAFVHTHESYGVPLVIHSTYIWILAEFGIIGAMTMIFLPFLYFCGLLINATKASKLEGGSRVWGANAAISLMLVFGVFSIAHDVAYQRMFWLLAGAFFVKVTRHS